MAMDNYDALEAKVLSQINADDWESAVALLQDGAAKGDGDCICLLGELYLHGVGVMEDSERAISLFKKALNMGNPHAAQNLGSLFGEGKDDVPVDEQKSFYYFSKGAELNFPLSMGSLAYCYLWGVGTNEDNDKAFSYGLQAAKLGDLNGMITTALCYDDGLGTPQDPYSAAHWYREALQREEKPQLMYRLSICLADPFEVFNIRASQEMLEESYHWASKAVETGHIEAHIIIAWFYEMGNVVGVDCDTSHKFLTIAANNGNGVAAELLTRYRKNIYGQLYLPQ